MSSETLNSNKTNLEKLYDINLQKTSSPIEENVSQSVETENIPVNKSEEIIKPDIPKSNLEKLYETAEEPTISNFEKLIIDNEISVGAAVGTNFWSNTAAAFFNNNESVDKNADVALIPSLI